MKHWIQELSRGGLRKAMPILSSPGGALTGATVQELSRDASAQCACMEAIAKRYPSIAALSMMDLSVEGEAFGCEVLFAPDEVPTVASRIVSDQAGVKALQVPEVGAGRTEVYLDTVRMAAQRIKDRPVLAGQIGPFSLAGRIFDITEILIAVFTEPEMTHVLLDKCTTFLKMYAAAFKAAGANGIVIAEPAAGLLSPEVCQEFSSHYVRRIVDAVQDDSFIVILHNCGNTETLVESMLSTDAAGLHFGNVVDLTNILPRIPANRVAFGNIDPANVFRGGSTRDVKNATFDLLENTRRFKNYVISSGCDIPASTSLENVDAFFLALDEYNSETTQ